MDDEAQSTDSSDSHPGSDRSSVEPPDITSGAATDGAFDNAGQPHGTPTNLQADEIPDLGDEDRELSGTAEASANLRIWYKYVHDAFECLLFIAIGSTDDTEAVQAWRDAHRLYNT